MELHDICDGCGKHPGVCMCGVSFGPDGAIRYRPHPVKLADKLRIITSNARLQIAENEKNLTPIAHCRWQALQAAKQGQFSVAILAYTYHLTNEEIDVLATELKNDGFRCEVSFDRAFLHLYWE